MKNDQRIHRKLKSESFVVRQRLSTRRGHVDDERRSLEQLSCPTIGGMWRVGEQTHEQREWNTRQEMERTQKWDTNVWIKEVRMYRSKEIAWHRSASEYWVMDVARLHVKTWSGRDRKRRSIKERTGKQSWSGEFSDHDWEKGRIHKLVERGYIDKEERIKDWNFQVGKILMWTEIGWMKEDLERCVCWDSAIIAIVEKYDVTEKQKRNGNDNGSDESLLNGNTDLGHHHKGIV